VRVILKQDVAKLGGAGDIVDVADGFANNFLVPRDLAMRATRGATKDAEALSHARRKREARTLGDAQELKATLEAAPVQITAKAGEDGTLYGSVGNSAIVEALRSQLGIRLDRRRIPLDRPLKTLGGHDIVVRVHPDLTATLRVEIVRGG
jgi:large subunit ribosomal protein L9